MSGMTYPAMQMVRCSACGATDRREVYSQQQDFECPSCRYLPASDALRTIANQFEVGDRRQYVYRVKDEFGVVIYVGHSASLCRRLRRHAVRSPFRTWAADVDVVEVASFEDGRRLEGWLIDLHRPRFNYRGNPDKSRLRVVASVDPFSAAKSAGVEKGSTTTTGPRSAPLPRGRHPSQADAPPGAPVVAYRR